MDQGHSDLFPETSLTMMHAIRAGSEATAAHASDQFARLYCEPLVRFVRSQRLFPEEEAKDLVQEFFLDVIIRRRALQNLDPKSWRLRQFLRVAVVRHLASHRRKRLCKKRGGAFVETSFDELKLPIAESDPAILEFERDWARAILDRVYDQLRHKFRTAGREDLYDELEGCIPWRSGDGGALVDIAQRFGMKDNAVKAQLKRIRDAYRKTLYAEVRETVLDPGEVDEEIKYLVKVLSAA